MSAFLPICKQPAWALLLLAGLFSACQTETAAPDTGRFGYEYFPLSVGQFSVYQVSDSVYALSAPRLTVRSYQLQEVVTESFTDASGDQAFRLERYSRPLPTAAWKLDSVWTAKLVPDPSRGSFNRAVRTENNVTFVKLIFPVAEGKRWNGNQFVGLQTTTDTTLTANAESYRMVAVYRPYSVGGIRYDSTLTVIQSVDTLPNLKTQDKRLEVFARGAGLIRREQVRLEFDISTQDILFGRKYRQTLLSYGKN